VSCDHTNILQKLPPSVARELVDRLARGQKVKNAAGWLMTLHRGELQHKGRYEMTKYVAAVKCCMEDGNCQGNGGCGCQAGKGARNAESENIQGINLPALTPIQRELQTKAQAMSPTSRMFVSDMVNSARRILKLEKQVRETEAATALPASSTPEGEQE
jgi:hypothetical protein